MIAVPIDATERLKASRLHVAGTLRLDVAQGVLRHLLGVSAGACTETLELACGRPGNVRPFKLSHSGHRPLIGPSAAGDVGVDTEEELHLPDIDLVARSADARALYGCSPRSDARVQATREGASAGLDQFPVRMSDIHFATPLAESTYAVGDA